MKSGYIKDNQLSASSNTKDVSMGRYDCCTDKELGGWCPDPNKPSRGSFFQISFPQPMGITKVLTQKPYRSPNSTHAVSYLTGYWLEYEEVGKTTFVKYSEGSGTAYIAAANATHDFLTRLKNPIYTKKLRIYMFAYQELPCVRIELYGCDPNGCTPPCLNGARCDKNAHKCICRTGFAGRQCELTKDNINYYNLAFQNITGDTLFTKNGTYRIHGNVTIEDGVVGNTLIVDTASQFVDLGNWGSRCMGNLDLCSYGIGISLYVKTASSRDMYILSSGGDLSDSHGVAIYRKSGTLYFVASTKKMKWSMAVPDALRNQTWHKLQMFWKKEGSGHLEVYIDGEKLTENVTTEARNVVQNPAVTNFFFGRSAAELGHRKKREIVETDISIEGPDFWEVDHETLTELEVIKGFPEMTTDPTLTATARDTGDEAPIDFKCQLPNVEDRLVKYEVEWLLNDVVIHQDSVTEVGGVSILTEEMLAGQMDMNTVLRCKVQTCYEQICSKEKSPPRYSWPLKPKIELISSDKITIEEGGSSAKVDFKINLPSRFFCGCKPDQFCDMRISVTIPKSPKDVGCISGQRIPQAVIGWEGRDLTNASCGVEITNSNWNKTITAIIKAKLDGKVDGDQIRDIQLRVHCYKNGTMNSSSPTTTKVQVTIIDRDKISTCQSVNDPHMLTFDGRSYDNMLEGEFVLYRHKTLPYQVNTFYRKCGRIPSCNCAVSIKSGDDVIVIDRCGPKRGANARPITVDLYKNGKLTPGTRIVRLNGGNKYQVHLPPGNIVTVQASYANFLNVWLTASPMDFNQTEGLCGSFDDDENNDLTTPQGVLIPQTNRYPNPFSQSWREKKTTSIYKGVCEDSSGSSSSSSSSQVTDNDIYCECSREWENKCGLSYDTIACQNQPSTPSSSEVTDYYEKNAKTPENCKKPDTDSEFEFNETWIPIPPDWPTPSGVTHQQATKYCTDYVMATAAAKLCGVHITLNMKTDIEGCIQDIKLTDDKSWAVVAVDSVKQACETVIQTNVSIWVNKDGVINPPTDITDTLCLNDCSGQGTCQKGVCQCKAGFVSPDCSIDINHPPTVITIPNGGVCQVNKNCKTVVIYGEKFVETPKLTCHIQYIKASQTKYERVGEKKKVKGHFINFNQVECETDFGSTTANGCTIAISNNGLNTSSKKVIYIIYDPKCQICDTGTGTCIIKAKTCLIDSKCYNEGDGKPGDINYVCNPSESKIKWTHRSKLLIHVHIQFEILITTIVTQYYNITNVGDTQLVEGHDGKGWLLNGSCLDFGQSSEACFNDIDQCKSGITISFWVKFISIAENTYIISNGGQSTKGKGFAMVYRFGQLHVIFKTSKMAWYLPCGGLKTNKWTLFEMSWHEMKGMLVYVDRAREYQQVIQQTNAQVIGSGGLYDLMFGCPSPSIGGSSGIHVVIDEYQMWTVSIDILIIKHIVGDRVTTAAPTTVPPTTTEQLTTTEPPTTEKPTTVPPTSTAAPTTVSPTTSQVMTTTREESTTMLYTGTTARPTCPSWCLGGGIPTVSKHPNLTYEVTTKQSILFYCNLPPASDPNVEYLVEWVSGVDVIHTEGWVAASTTAWGKVVFNIDDHSEAKLANNLYCQIRARYGGQCKGTVSKPPLISNKFIARIEVITKYLEVIEGLTWKVIKVKFWAPPIFFCYRTKIGPSGVCVLRLEALFEVARREYRCRNGDMIHQAVVGWEGKDKTIDNAFCGILVTNENWKQVFELKIKAKIDGKYDGDQIRRCDVVLTQIHQSRVVKVTICGSVTVKIINRDYKSICSSVNDPHMKTFDGQRYDNFHTGEFILYKHKTLKLQVDAFYVKCSRPYSRATCNCGVAVKAGDDVVVFNKCQRAKRGRVPLMVYMFLNGQFTSGVRVLRIGCGNKYEVHLPTGTYVTVEVQKGRWASGMFINVWVTPSASDYQQTEGLCGYYDQNRRNDLTKSDGSVLGSYWGRPDRFSLSWRVEEEESIFYGVKMDYTYTHVPVWCDCTKRSENCALYKDVELCDVKLRGVDVTSLLIREALAPNPPARRRKRAAVVHTDNAVYQPIEYEKDFVAGNASWPTPNGWTEAKSTEYCTNFIMKTQAAKNCGKLLNDSFTDEIASCVSDIKVTDSTSWAQAALDSIVQDCTSEVNKYAAETGNGTNATSPDAVNIPGGVTLEQLEGSLCPQNCSGNGSCEGGRCVCFTGYFGDACELSKSDVPELSNMQRDGLCDVRSRDCSSSIIYGTTFIESPDLVCKVVVYDLDSSTKGKTHTMNVTYVNINQVICALPAAQGSFLVSVSNNGLTYSNELLFVGYDSVCYTCTIKDQKGSCQATRTGCEIKGKCYRPKEINAADKCQVCDPSVARNSWTTNPSKDCAANTNPLTSTDIAVICVVAAILVLLVVVSVVYTQCIRKKPPPKKDSASDHDTVRFVRGKYTGSFRVEHGRSTDAATSMDKSFEVSNPAFDHHDLDS